ncbi:MAG: lipopolysaccharide biosynthesis protein [Clostridiales bacterium]|nr:lipopolysaccharide biosynthesis protein [Clostridiales bacterium]
MSIKSQNRRSENSVKNSLFAIVGQAVALIFGFVTRKQFIAVLGEVYLGVNGVFCSVLSLLSLTELGLGSAITFALYKPLADGDDESTGRIMNLYALAYRIVAAAVTLIGLCLLPFLGWMTREVPQVGHMTLIYLLFLANSAASYLFSYRRALITASERDWRNSVNTSIFSILQNAAQLVIIIYTQNYILYLVAQLAITLISNFEISHAASKMFPYLKNVKGLPSREETSSIAKNVKAMFVNRFGGVAVTGTDNLLIASIDVVLVGLYSNYLLILQTIQVILSQVINAVTASVGNLLASDDSERRSEIYLDVTFAVAWLYGFSAIALDCLMTRFIAFAFGAGLEIPELAVHIMALNFYLNGIRQPNLMYINAAGLFRPIRFKGFVEAAINLGVSAIFLACGMGLFGVLLGTTVSHFATSLWWEPYCVDKYCLGNNSARRFALKNVVYAVVLAAAWLITRLIVDIMPLGFIGFMLAAVVVLVIPNAIFLIIYHRSEQFGFFKGILLRILSKLKLRKD